MHLLPTLIAVVLLGAVTNVTRARADEAPPDTIEAWLDGIVTEAMTMHDVPGVVVGLTIEGKTILRGYGLADVEARVPMDPETTILPVASVSKVYTAAVVLELAAQGRLHLDDDIGTLVEGLTFRGDFDEPITLTHLLTHTAGLDERNLNRYLPLDHAGESVRDYLLDSMPRRIRPPGRIYQYSNHGMALAGLAGEEVAKKPFPVLLDELVLAPLGMARTSMAPDAERNARGYVKTEDSGARPPHYVRTAYSGMLVSTAADQMRMIDALLNRTSLDPQTIAGLMSPQFRHDDVSCGSAFGMFEDRWSNTPYYWHEGQTRGFYAGFYVVPEKKIGLFVACNRHHSALVRTLRYEMLREFVGPATRETDLTPSDVEIADLAPRISGTYRRVRHARQSPEFILTSLIGRAPEITVAAEDGQFRIGRGGFVPARDLLLVEPETGAVNGFIADGDGPARYLYYQREAFERVAFHARETVRDGWVMITLLVNALTLLAWGGLAIVRRAKADPADARTRARWRQAPALVVQIAFLVGLIMAAGQFRGDAVFQLMLPWPAWMEAIFVLPWIAAILAPIQILTAMATFMTSEVRWVERFHHALLGGLAAAFVLLAWQWGLLSTG